jgi:hypothetical protein
VRTGVWAGLDEGARLLGDLWDRIRADDLSPIDLLATLDAHARKEPRQVVLTLFAILVLTDWKEGFEPTSMIADLRREWEGTPLRGDKGRTDGEL